MTDYKELIRKLREADHVATSDDTGAFRFDDKLAAEAALFIECLIQVCGEAYRRVSDLEHEARKRAEAEVYRRTQAERFGLGATPVVASEDMLATAMFGDFRENGNG